MAAFRHCTRGRVARRAKSTLDRNRATEYGLAMLTAFDHVNICTRNLDRMIAWYGDILGLRPGARPPFAFEGAWLYIGDSAVVHLVQVDTDPRSGGDLGA